MKTLSKILAVALLAACAEINPQTATDASENEIILKENGAQTRAGQALEPGDEIGLFAVKTSQPLQPKNNAINNAKLLVQNDLTIKGEQVIYYPNRTDKVDFYSYFPYQSGNATADALGVLVGIRTTQTDFSSLKSSDLCYGSAKGVTPTNSAQSITYTHAFAQLKLNFSAYNGCPAIKSVKLLNIKDSASLNLATGALTLRSHLAEITPQKLTTTDPNSKGEYLAIVPAQPLQGACVAVTLTDYTTYIYSVTDPLALTAGATSILNLNIVDKSTVQMEAAPAITAWQPIALTASTTQSIDNQITLRWLVPHQSFATVDKIVLTLTDLFGNTQDVEVAPTLDPTSTATYALYTFALQVPSSAGGGASGGVGSGVIKGGGMEVGADGGVGGGVGGGGSAGTALSYPIVVTRLRLYAGATLLRDAPKSAIIALQIPRRGAHTLGLHLSNAVLIGNLWWAKGNLVADGANGAKIGAPTDGGLFFQFGSLIGWNGGANGDGTGIGSPALGIKIKPVTCNVNPGWMACPRYTGGTTIADRVPFASDNGASGIGDPCRYYLGSPWRLPTAEECSSLCNGKRGADIGFSWADCNAAWQSSPAGGNFNNNATKLFFPASGICFSSSGSLGRVGDRGHGWSSSVRSTSDCFYLTFDSRTVYPQDCQDGGRSLGFPVRCVQ